MSFSFAISPLSNFLNFYIAFFGAQGATKDFFEIFLLFKEDEYMKVGLQALVDDLAVSLDPQICQQISKKSLLNS